MTAPALPGTVDHGDPRTILGLGLPAHVLVRLDDSWAPAWLIGRPQCADGWVALVQCEDATGREQTFRLAPDRVAAVQPVSLPRGRRR